MIGIIFLLFPIADFRVWDRFPIYMAEIPLLVLIGTQGFRWFSSRPYLRWNTLDRWMFSGLTLFFLGTLFSFLYNHLSFHSIGLMKSFIILPLLLAVGMRQELVSTRDHHRVLVLWYVGLVGGALVAIGSMFFGGVTYDNRLTAWYDSPNQLALLLGPGVLIGVYFLLLMSKQKLFLRLVAASSLLTIILPLWWTRSYGVMAAVWAAALFLVLATRGKRTFLWLLLSMLIVGAAWIYTEHSTEKFQSLIHFDSRSSLASRFTIWTVALRAVEQSFPWGIGVGQFQSVYLSYQANFPPYLEWAVPEPHNLLLAIYLSSGLLGLLGFLTCLYLCLAKLRLFFISKGQDSLPALYSGLLGYWMLAGVVDTTYFDNAITFGLWGIIGGIWAIQGLEQPKIEERGSSRG